MRRRLDLQIPPIFVVVEISSQRALDLFGPRVVTLDEIAVIGIHDPHDAGETGGCARMQRLA